MTEQTRDYISHMIASDKTISASEGKMMLAILSGNAEASVANDELKTRSEAAKMLRVSPVTVTSWGKRGIIHAVRIKGRRKAVGYSLSSINAFISGGEVDKGVGV